MDRSDLELVLAVRDGGSLTAAALSLDVAPPVVTKRLAALEAKLGQRLFQRTTRRVSPTAEGETVCERAQVLLQGFMALESELQERKAEPTGLIRLAATFGFGRLWLGPALAAFQERYPRIEIQLQLTEHLPDLAFEGFDGAIWLWSVQGRQAAQWVSRRLARNQRVLVASPRYIKQHGAPAGLEALQEHACLIVRENGNAAGQRFDIWQLHRERDKTPARVRYTAHWPAIRVSWCAIGAWKAAASCCAACGISRRSWPQANWCACCRPGRCPMPTSTGWRLTAPTSPGAFAC
jgi:LysR family transcriptional activator of dmlA